MAGAAWLAFGVLLGSQDPATAIVQLPEGTTVTGTMLVDLDDDGRTDLVLACHDAATEQRSLRLYLRQPDGPAFTTTPSGPPLAIDRDVIAFTFAPCLPGAGPELILMTAEQVAVRVPAVDGGHGYRRLARHRLVWPAADAGEVLPLPDAAVDFDGDGLVDLVLPSPDGWTVLFQDRDGDEPRFEQRAELVLPPWQDAVTKAVQGAGVGGRGFTLGFGADAPGRPARSEPLVRVATRAPACQLVDLDGDGRLDLATQRNGRMFAAYQTARRRLERRERALPLPPDRLTLADPAFDVQFTDVDGDGRADLLLTTSARRDDDIETRVDLYLTGPDDTWPARPSCRLRLQALAEPPALVDVDGDGRRDLACLSLRTASMRDFLGETASSLDAQLSLFRNDGARFARPPLLTRPLPLAAGESRLAAPFLLVRPARDGRPGSVLMHLAGGVQCRALEASGERLRLGAKSAQLAMPRAAETAGDDRAQARILAADADGAELLILFGSEVRHVRFAP